jgi:parvulin-like peptidyl-prolyl cis-trans isomerase-like protein
MPARNLLARTSHHPGDRMIHILRTRRARAGILLALLTCCFRVAGAVAAEPSSGPEPLADSVVLARVNDRTIRARDMVAAYFNMYPPDRPPIDSTGRAELLSNMINKEVMTMVAAEANRPLEFEDRIKLREHTERLLSNLLYQRVIVDSVSVTEEDLQRAYQRYQWEVHLQHILFDDRATAERVRSELIRKKISWPAAVKKHAEPTGSEGPDGDLGWKGGSSLGSTIAAGVMDLRPGGLSPVIEDDEGYQLLRLVARRPVKPLPFESARDILYKQLHSQKLGERGRRYQDAILTHIGARFDTTNLIWASSHFGTPLSMQDNSLRLNVHLPHFAGADTERVLVRWSIGQMALGEFVTRYGKGNPATRRAVTNWRRMRTEVGGMILEPFQAEYARAMGLEKDPQIVNQVARKREQLMVDHLYRDSIESRTFVTPEQRRKFYRDNLTRFVTYPAVRFANFAAVKRATADSVAELIRKGSSALDLIRADSLAGGPMHGKVYERNDQQKGTAFYTELFEEMRPGDVRVVQGPEDGWFHVLHLLSFDPGHQLSYEEAQPIIIESVENLTAERLLKDFLARHRRRYRIESHPDLVTRVVMKDPAL